MIHIQMINYNYTLYSLYHHIYTYVICCTVKEFTEDGWFRTGDNVSVGGTPEEIQKMQDDAISVIKPRKISPFIIIIIIIISSSSSSTITIVSIIITEPFIII